MGRDLSLNDVPKPGHYKWTMTVAAAGGTARTYWGATDVRPDTGQTMGDITEVIRRLCADRLGAPEQAVTVVRFSFTS